jgi:hypothetical protein
MNELDLIALDQSRLLLRNIPGVTVLGEWHQVANPATWMLPLRLELLGAASNDYVPSTTEWELVVDFGSDSIGKVQLHPASNDAGMMATFPHQTFNGGPHPSWPCRNGHLCTVSGFDRLAANRNAWPDEPGSTIPRIHWHVERSLQWLILAAQDALAQPGDPYELPDFNVSAADDGLLAYYEDAHSLDQWMSHSEESGVVHLDSLNGKAVYMIRGFFDFRNREALFKPAWGAGVKELSTGAYRAFWLRLPAVPVLNRWQVPSTFAELREAISQQGQDLSRLLEPLWKHLPDSDLFILIGAPIPHKVGESPAHYHWQALRVAVPLSQRVKPKAREAIVKNHLRSSSPLRWLAKSENWHPNALQNRGQLSPALVEAKVVMLGAGALGSNLAEQLVRMGLRHLTLVDEDVMKAENLVRHTLTLQDLFRRKTEALVTRLNQSNPSAQVRSLAFKAPTLSNEETLVQALQEATLVIDATASDQLLQAMPLTGMGAVPFVSCSLGLKAEDLFFYAVSAQDFSWGEFSAWYAPFRQVQNTLAQQMDLPRDAGCWQPLTPAKLNRIAALAGIAVELIEQAYEQPESLPAKLCYKWPNPKLKPSL